MFKYVRGVACRDWVQCIVLHHVSFSVFVACNDAQMLTAHVTCLRAPQLPLSLCTVSTILILSQGKILILPLINRILDEL